MHPSENDTIAALATAPGDAGVAVIRVSGPEALSVSDRGFRGTKRLAAATGYSAHYGTFTDPSGRALDEVIALVFRGPHSFTGEDSVELTCHGGSYVSRQIVRALMDFGARHAEPGEFTRRAFLHGRLDLSQAEAVADLIHARSRLAHQASLRQLEGALSGRVRTLREQLMQAMALLELELDFAEEGYEFIDKTQVESLLFGAIGTVTGLKSSFEAGRLVHDGVRVVLTGSPNVGKSSLLNRLLQEERAIVTEIPGTTRDTLEEEIQVEGLLFRLIDTAGIRATDDVVEREGVRRAEEQVRNADVVAVMFDRSRPLEKQDIGLAEQVLVNLKRSGASAIIILNKSDLPDAASGDLGAISHLIGPYPRVDLSCRTGDGMERFREVLLESVGRGTLRAAEESVMVTSLRHYSAFTRACESLQLALDSARTGQTGELIAVDLRRSLESLGEIIGEVTSEDILNDIFSRFCIGK